jgi:hypothetical protein
LGEPIVLAAQIDHPLWPSLRWGNGCPETLVGPFISDPVNVIFCPAARASAKSGPLYPALFGSPTPYVMESPRGRILHALPSVGQGS